MLNSIVSSPRCPREADSCCRPIIITRRKRARISSWISRNPWTFSLVVRSTNVLTLAHVERIFSSKIARITIFVLGTINESVPGTGTPRGKDCLVEQWCTPIKRTLGPLLLEEVGKRKKGIERMEYRNRPSIKGPTTCRGSLPLWTRLCLWKITGDSFDARQSRKQTSDCEDGFSRSWLALFWSQMSEAAFRMSRSEIFLLSKHVVIITSLSFVYLRFTHVDRVIWKEASKGLNFSRNAEFRLSND